MAKSNVKTNSFSWDSEMMVGYINSTETQKTSVAICTKNDKNFVSVTKLFRTKNSTNFIVKSGIAIPFESAQQVAALIEAAVKQGQKLGW